MRRTEDVSFEYSANKNAETTQREENKTKKDE